jgi:long-chain acyl-CoA synthetase
MFPTVRDGFKIITIPELFLKTSKALPKNLAFQWRKNNQLIKYSYSQAKDATVKLSNFLMQKGFKKGDRAAIISENRPEWAFAYLAILFASGTVVPLDPHLSQAERRYILQDAQVKITFASQRYYDEMLELKPDLKLLKEVISLEDLEKIKANSQFDKTKLPQLDDLAVILYTSGTTGFSKAVMLSHLNIVSNINSIHQCIDFNPNDNFFSILPLNHVFEATAGFLTPVSVGAAITYARSLKSKEIQEDMKTSKPTVLLVVPLFLEKLLLGIKKEIRRLPFPAKFALSVLRNISQITDFFLKGKAKTLFFRQLRKKTSFDSLRFIVSGGAALPIWVSKNLEGFGFPILQGYGLSETSPVLTVNPPSRPKNRSVGMPIPGVKIKIHQPDSQGIGEIAVKGDNVMLGYYKNPQATKEAFTKDGWFLTGDIGYLDNQGYLYITGRKKSVIVTSGGKNIYPEEIEEKLLASPFIEEVLVTAGKNPRTGNVEPEAIIFPSLDAWQEYFPNRAFKEEAVKKVLAAEIKKQVANLAEWKRPKRFKIRLEEFPKTTTKKIKRYLF